MNIELSFREWKELCDGLQANIEEAVRLQKYYENKLEELPPDCESDDAKSYRKRLRELENREETFCKILTGIEMHKI